MSRFLGLRNQQVSSRAMWAATCESFSLKGCSPQSLSSLTYKCFSLWDPGPFCYPRVGWSCVANSKLHLAHSLCVRGQSNDIQHCSVWLFKIDMCTEKFYSWKHVLLWEGVSERVGKLENKAHELFQGRASFLWLLGKQCPHNSRWLF